MRDRILFAAACAMGVAAHGGCRSATEVRVEVITDVPCADHGGTTITVGRIGAIETADKASSSTRCTDGRVGALVIVPSDANDDEIAFKVVTGIRSDPATCKAPDYGPSCIVARRALRFLPHTSLTVPVAMRGTCAGVACTPDTTCVSGVCRPAKIVDPSTCESSVGCGEQTLLPPTGDAGTGDASSGDGGDASTTTGIELALGATHSCALMPDTTVKCWGDSSNGALGLGQVTGDILRPTAITGFSGVTQLAAGTNYTCAVMNDHSVRCWGTYFNTSLGVDTFVPTPVPNLTNVGQIAAARYQTCALSTDGVTLTCWGSFGMVAPGAPTSIPLPGPAKMVRIGENMIYVLLRDGHVRVFGKNPYGQLGIGDLDGGTEVDYRAAVEIPGLTNVDVVATQGNGGNTSCAHATTGEVWCWGRNLGGETGTSAPNDVAVATLATSITMLAELALTDSTTCYRRTDAKVACFGVCDTGQCGDPAATTGPTAQVIPTLSQVERIWSGGDHLCARTTDGVVHCWGQNGNGQLGDGTKNVPPTPVTIAW